MRAKILGLGLICLFIFAYCDKLKNPYSPDLTNPRPVISIAISGLTSTYNSGLDSWSWEFQVTLTESNDISVTITELEARVYYNRSWWLDRTIYSNHRLLPANGSLTYDVAVLSGENVDRIKVYFEGEDENGNSIAGAQNFHLGDFKSYDDKFNTGA